MASVNKVILIGNLTADPELKQTPSGVSVTAFTLAVQRRFTNKENQIQLWQNGYFDHIVRDEEDFLRIWRYIDNNPASWLEDKYYIK